MIFQFRTKLNSLETISEKSQNIQKDFRKGSELHFKLRKMFESIQLNSEKN